MSEEMKKTAVVSKEKIRPRPKAQPVAAERKEADLDEIAGGSKFTLGNKAGTGKGV